MPAPTTRSSVTPPAPWRKKACSPSSSYPPPAASPSPNPAQAAASRESQRMPIFQTSSQTPSPPSSPPSSQTSGKSSLFRAPSSMFWAGFIIRVLYITIVHTYRIRPEEDHLQFGWEMGRIARALATGFGYADPFSGHSGPTAWSPPLYPLLIAGVFKIFGVYTSASAWVLLTINSIFSAATSSVIYEIAARCFHQTGRGRKIALWSGWLWALYPAAMQFAVRWIWDMCLTAFLFSTILVIALRLRGVGEESHLAELP